MAAETLLAMWNDTPSRHGSDGGDRDFVRRFARRMYGVPPPRGEEA